MHPRPHRVTGEAPAERLLAEASLLGPLPRLRYDTARREPRVASAPLPFVEVDTVPYSVPPELVGTTVEVRIPLDAGILEISHRGVLVVTHTLAPPGSGPVWDPAHRAAAEAIALSPHRRHLSLVHGVGEHPSPEPAGSSGLELGAAYEVEAIDLSRYDRCGCSGAGA